MDDIRARISYVLQDSTLCPSTARSGKPARMNHVRVGGLSLSTLSYAIAMHADAGKLDDYYLVVLCLDGHAEIISGTQRTMIGQSTGTILGPRTPFAGNFSPDSEQFLLRMDRTAVMSHTGFDNLELGTCLDLSQPAFIPWISQLKLLASSPEMISIARANPVVAVEMERLLISLLLAAHPFHTEGRERQGILLPRTIKRAVEYINEHACDPICLGDIANAAGVPIRTLLDGFKKFHNASPMAIVRETRMTHVRQKLLEAQKGHRVTEIAMSCGFINLGRFSSMYQQQFGETPSETLRRSACR